jgi:arginase
MENQYILTPFFLDEPMPGLEALAQPGWQINKPNLTSGSKQARMGVLYQSLAKAVADAVRRGARPVSVAGDCCTSIGVLAGLQQADIDPRLIWFDAHGDFNTWETTPSGFLGGMPLAMLVGRGEGTIAEAVGLHPQPETQVILTDARDLDPGESVALQSSDVIHLRNVKDVLQYPFGGLPLYIHLDTDVIDPRDAPAMNYMTPGGPRADDLKTIFHFLAANERILAVSLSSWNPALEGASRAQDVCMELLQILAS